MKKAVLLLAMVTLIAGCIYLKNADRDTVLYEQEIEQDVQEPETPVAEEIQETVTIESPSEDSTIIKVDGSGITDVIYGALTPEEQTVYSEILSSLAACEEETELSTLDPVIIDKAFSCVMLEHPEIFYVDGYKYTEYSRAEKVEKIVFTGKYLYDKDEIIRRQELIEGRVASIFSGMPVTQDEYLKIKYLYDTLVAQTEYDINSTDNQNICSVFLNGKSVCQGYAKALQYLAKLAGMECYLVLGNVLGGEEHAWNLAKVNDAWYYLDVTWGDAYYLFANQEQVAQKKTSVINYDYLCVTTQQLLQTHKPDMPVELPQCLSMTDNYYIREGLYFTGFDENRLADIFSKAIAGGQETVTIKCSNQKVYEEIYGILLDEQKIFDFIESDGTVAYTDNEEQQILTFWLFEGRY